MKNNYELSGMSCGGCVNNVKRALMEIPGVTDAEVMLHPQRAVLTLNKPIEVTELQSLLSKAGRYTINETPGS